MIIPGLSWLQTKASCISKIEVSIIYEYYPALQFQGGMLEETFFIDSSQSFGKTQV